MVVHLPLFRPSVQKKSQRTVWSLSVPDKYFTSVTCTARVFCAGKPFCETAVKQSIENGKDRSSLFILGLLYWSKNTGKTAEVILSGIEHFISKSEQQGLGQKNKRLLIM